jgi:uncharacterized protein YidB (DUF937 family)
MGLLDQITGSLGGQSGSVDYVAIMKWVEQQGGISGLLDKFRQGGLTEIVQSWISSGQNLPISADQIQQIFSSETIGQLASKLGLDNGQTSSVIAEFLPQIVDKLSPNGQEPSGNDLLSMGMGLLKDKFFK